jgi:hypothetical protein
MEPINQTLTVAIEACKNMVLLNASTIVIGIEPST